MKLRKALEKAREAREGADGGFVNAGAVDSGLGPEDELQIQTHDKPVEPAGQAGGKWGGADEWMPPTYNQSSQIHLDENHLRENRCFCYFSDSKEADYYKVLRAHIQQRTRGKGWRSLMITSPLPNEGKTLTSVNLALTFAREFNQTVILVDADLRRQQIHKRFGYPSTSGLVNYLLDDTPLSDIVVWPGVEKLTVISGGRTVYDSTELLGSPKMKSLAEEMKDRYPERYVIYDAPTVLGTADAIAFTPYVDCVLMVVESGSTTVRNVQEALKFIPKEKFLGFVLNRQGVMGENPY